MEPHIMYQKSCNGDPNAIQRVLTEDCKATFNKLISELDLFATILALDTKQTHLWQGEATAAEYVRRLKDLSGKKIRKLLMDITLPLSSLNPTTMKCVMEDVYRRCAVKWNFLKPIEYLRSILFIEERIGECFAEIQRKKFMETRGLYPPPNASVQQTKNIAPSVAQRSMLNETSPATSSLTSQSLLRASYETPQQALPSAPLRPRMDSNQPGNLMQNTLQYQNGLQQTQQQSIPVNHTPPPYNSSLRQMKQAHSTAPVSTTQSQINRPLPQMHSMSATQTQLTHPQSVSNNNSAVDANATSVYMPFRINQSLQNTTVSNLLNPTATSVQRKQYAASANNQITKNTFSSQALIDLTSNTPPATPISTDLPILDSSDIADVFNEIPQKKMRLENALETTSNCVGSRVKSPAADCLLKMALASRIPTRIDELNIQKPFSVTETHTQLAPKIPLANETVPANESNEKQNDSELLKMDIARRIRTKIDELNTQTTYSMTENQTQNAPKSPLISETVPANESEEKRNDGKLPNETDSKNASTTVIDAKPIQANLPIAFPTNEKDTPMQQTDDNGNDDDYVILIETYTECKPKIEKVEKVEIVEEEQVIDGSLNGEVNGEVNGTGQSNNDPPKIPINNHEQSNRWYEDISSDSDMSALVIDM